MSGTTTSKMTGLGRIESLILAIGMRVERIATSIRHGRTERKWVVGSNPSVKP
jgi:hypothetical protein